MSRSIDRAGLMLRQAQHEAPILYSVYYFPRLYTRAAVSWYSFAFSAFE
jgi:hypothetical protein